MISECTDCTRCANFCFGYRVFCLAEGLSSNAVGDYEPVGNGNAADCLHFARAEWIGAEKHFSQKDLEAAEAFSKERHGEATYEGIREWVEQQLAREVEEEEL